MTTPPPLCGGDHDDTGIDNCDACQAEVVEPRCAPGCPACRDDGREYAWIPASDISPELRAALTKDTA